MLKQKSKIGIATKERKVYKAFKPNPQEERAPSPKSTSLSTTVNSFSQKQPQAKPKIIPMGTDTIPMQQYKK